jgi:hypothetical protein
MLLKIVIIIKYKLNKIINYYKISFSFKLTFYNLLALNLYISLNKGLLLKDIIILLALTLFTF